MHRDCLSINYEYLFNCELLLFGLSVYRLTISSISCDHSIRFTALLSPIKNVQFNMNLDEVASHLFEKQLSHAQLKKIVTDHQSTLPQLMAVCGKYTIKSPLPATRLSCFKHNYQTAIVILAQRADNPSVNNFSLHFINLLSHSLIQQSKLEQAKELLKKGVLYIDNPHCDPPLLAICLNNLALLQKRNGKHFKALRLALKGMEVMQAHIRHLKQSKNKPQLIEDAVILVAIISLCRSVLARIIRESDARIYRKIYEFTNYMGYRNCLKYLGRASFLIRRFTPVEKEFRLPVFRVEEREERREENDNEKLIIRQLENIYDVLKAKQSPEYVFLNTGSNVSQQSIQMNSEIELPKVQPSSSPTLLAPPSLRSIKQKPRQQENPGNMVGKMGESSRSPSDTSSQLPLVLAEQVVSFGKWQIKLRLEKQRGQQLGNLLLDGSNKRQSFHEVIPQQKLLKIIQQINVEDKLSYEIINEQLKQQEFLEHYIKPFMQVNPDNGQVSIHPKCTGLLPPLPTKFIGQEGFLFLNHVRHNLFRLSISPYYSSKSVYLNIEFSPDSMLLFFSFVEFTIDFITAIYKTINSAQTTTIPVKIKNPNKDCRIINQPALLAELQQIVAEFEELLLHREQETSINEIIENELFYYKYQEIELRKGKYYLVRYLPGIHCFDLYLQNNYETHAIDRKVKARGNTLYKHREFLQDFGIPLSLAKHKLFAYIEIITKKYELLTFDRPLTDNDSDRYIENAILEYPLTENCFKTKFFNKNNYVVPITISLLSINSQIPVGIKIVEYSPIEGQSKGMFIHIIPQEWLRPFRRPPARLNSVLFKNFIGEFEFRRDYFLPEWLQKNGFHTLFEKVLDPENSLYLEENINRFMRGTTLIKIFNNEDSI